MLDCFHLAKKLGDDRVSFIIENSGTISVIAILIIAVVLIVRKAGTKKKEAKNKKRKGLQKN